MKGEQFRLRLFNDGRVVRNQFPCGGNLIIPPSALTARHF